MFLRLAVLIPSFYFINTPTHSGYKMAAAVVAAAPPNIIIKTTRVPLMGYIIRGDTRDLATQLPLQQNFPFPHGFRLHQYTHWCCINKL